MHSWEDKGVHNFPKGICPKVNVMARLEYELAYYDSAVHRFNHYTTKTPLMQFVNKRIYYKPIPGGAHGVMVIVVGNGHGDTSSITGRD